ncbi:MAG TPA: beta-ketoacyl synthase N-terminal-like domain-containing protein [Pyrinomonadaceae bacterium]|nr:beta-ketoacyl synthase N-terminal-like domain-containing protein [Pyrinomonadaceae bacterium]
MSSADKFSYDIAVVGMAGRFPGARTVEELWRNLRDGVESVSFFSEEELLERGVEPALLADANYVRAGAVVEDAELFDASFFGFTPREAEMMDPQHRLFLEHAWQALEAAGYAPEKYAGRVGVFAGESVNSYLLQNLLPRRELIESVGVFQTLIGNDRDHLATQTAYKLNLKGPCLNIQTACSTSLVAVHVACQSLLNQECDMALAGGVSVGVPQGQGALYQEGGIVSPDGHCRAFDARAGGTVKGSGVGVVVLKRLADALADGDSVEAVIKGSAINNDGSLKVGYTAPSVEGQAGVIEEALAAAAVEPETITYVETHGTGTALGDPVEIAALTQAFGAAGAARGTCAIGSLKTNIGHLDAAAGVAGLIKTVLALRHREIPPSLHFERPNPNIDFERTPFYVNTALAAWESNGSPRRAGVSSFGIGGTNAHVVLEEAPAVGPSGASRAHQLLTLSARTAAALESATADLASYLKERPRAELADVAYTLQLGRSDFTHRRAFVCRDAREAVSALESADAGRARINLQEHAGAAGVVFMFPGQGSQYAHMGRELYEAEPTFRAEVDRCAELLSVGAGLDLLGALYGEADSDEAASRLAQTSVTQPALFVVEYALAKLLMGWGVRPEAMIGHSIGEYVAACLAGVFSLEDALKLVSARGRLMQAMPAGAMLAVPLSEQGLLPFLSDAVSVAAVNGPAMCVVSGASEEIQRTEARLAAEGVASRRLHTSHAYHSEMMQPVVGQFEREVASVRLHAPRIPYVSGLTGTWVKPEEATDAGYWSRQLRAPVRFAAGVAELLKEKGRVLLEVGPGQSLTTLARQQQNGSSGKQNGSSGRLVLSALARGQESELRGLLETLGQLWSAGVAVDWAAFYSGQRRRRVPLPTYPFERQRYWIDAPAQGESQGGSPDALRRKPDAAEWFYVPSWKRSTVPREQATTAKGRCSLIFADETGLASLVARRLEDEGAEVFVVKAGERFGRVAERVYEINPRLRADYDALLSELRANGKTPEAILHAWGVSDGPEAGATPDAFESSQARGFYSLLFMMQAIGESLPAGPLKLAVVTSGVQEVTGEESLSPPKATALGLCKVIPQEYPQVSCRSIDVTLPAREAEREALAAGLAAELAAPDAETTIAYRGRHRWVQIFEPVELAETPGAGRLREGGVYLLTGGPGGIDWALARSLAAAVRCKLVMRVAEPLPAREGWRQWLEAHDEQDEVSRLIRAVSELEEAGAEVLTYDADPGDLERMASVVAHVRGRFGPVGGVFHTAAATGGGMIQLKTPEAVEAVFRPKVAGTLALQSLLEDEPPDFFVLFSTTLSLTGVFGQADYCAANAFLDAFARAETAAGKTLTVAVNWNLPHWEDWQGSAPAMPSEFQTQLAEMREAYGLTHEEGVGAVRRIVEGPHPQVVVSTQDFQSLMDAQKQTAAGDLLDQLRSARVAGGAQGGERAEAYARPEGETEQRVAAAWEEMFGVERVGRRDNFFELGGNSLIAIQLVSQIRKIFQVELPLNHLFESPTVEGLARAVEERRQKAKENEEIERLLGEIEGLSLDELQAHLSRELQTGSEQTLDG